MRALGDSSGSGQTALMGGLSQTLETGSPSVKFAALGTGEEVSAKARLLAAQAERRPDSPQENPSVGVGHARLDRSIWRGSVAGTPSRPQVPTPSLAL